MIMTNEKIRGAAFHHIALKAADFDKSLALNQYQAHVYYRKALSLYHLADYAASMAELANCTSLGLENEECKRLRINLLKKLEMK